MCNAYCISFGAINLMPEEVKGKKVIEVGSYDVNGSLRPLVESYYPAEYIGVDIVEGPGVDIICEAEDILERFGKERFNIVIALPLGKTAFELSRYCKNALTEIDHNADLFTYNEDEFHRDSLF